MGFGNVNKKLLGCNQIRNFLVQGTLFKILTESCSFPFLSVTVIAIAIVIVILRWPNNSVVAND